MADELEPVTQPFEADLTDYIEPIRDGSDETQGFADVVEETTETLSGLRDAAAETGAGVADLAESAADAGAGLADMDAGADGAAASVDALAGSEDDASVSTETLAETVARLRDAAYEAYPGIDDATASLLAEAGAAELAGAANEGAALSMGDMARSADGLEATLLNVKNILGAAELGESVTVAKSGLGEFFIQTEAEADNTTSSLLRLTTGTKLLDDAMTKADKDTAAFWEAVNFLGPSLANSENIAEDAASALRLLGASENEAAAGGNALAKAQSGLEGLAGGGGGILESIMSFFSGGGESGAGIGAALGNVGALGAGMLVVVPLIAGVVMELGSFVSSLLIAGIGVGSFVALAIPSFEAVKNAYEGISTAQAAYNQAVQLEKKDPTADNLAAVATAAANLKIAYQDVPPYIRPVLSEIDQLKNEYTGLAKAFEPDVFSVFNAGLKIANNLLPDLTPEATAAAGALTKILDGIGKITQQDTTASKPLRIGNIVGTMPGSEQGTDTGFNQFLEFVKTMEGPIMTTVASRLESFAGEFAKVMQSFSKKDYITAIGTAFDILTWILEGTSEAIHNVMTYWDGLTEAIKNSRNWFDDTSRASDQFAADIRGDMKKAVAGVQDFSDNTSKWLKDAEHDYDVADGDVEAFVKDVVGYVEKAGSDTEHAWDTAVADVVTITGTLPGKAVAALSSLPGRMEAVGEQAIDSIARGIEDREGAVEGAVEHIASLIPDTIASLLGMHSPSVVLRQQGRTAGESVALGLLDAESTVASAAGQLGMAAAGTGLAGGYAGRAAGGGQQLQLATSVTVQLDSQTLLKATQTASRVWNRRNVSNSLTLRNR